MKTPKISIVTSLYRGAGYLKSYLSHLSRITNLAEIEVILVHNDPTEEELTILKENLDKRVNLVHLQTGREGLYSSWNRAVRVAKGDYVTIWNVDDVRLPNSVKEQAEGLDQHPNAAMAYGDFVVVNTYGATEGVTICEPEFEGNERSFTRRHHVGCFPMWRREVHQSVGYFDEQFRLIADLDFQIRVAKVYSMVKVNKHFGYYLAGTPSNLSSNYKLQDLEHTAMHLRYGNYDLINLTYLFSSMEKIKIFKLKWFNTFHDLKADQNGRFSLSNFPLLAVSLFKFPRHIARKYFRQYLRFSH